ncbi:MAG: hypothetical protein Kow0069_12040 [Promethearchaeota archaeon]
MVRFAVLCPGRSFDASNTGFQPELEDLLEEFRDLDAGGAEFAIAVEGGNGSTLVACKGSGGFVVDLIPGEGEATGPDFPRSGLAAADVEQLVREFLTSTTSAR